MKYLSILIFYIITNPISAQTLTGKITDAETNEDLIGANIIVIQNGQYKAGASTDFDGNYSLQVDAGTYDVEVNYIGYPPNLITGVEVLIDEPNQLNVQLGGGEDGIDLESVMMMCCTIRMIHADETTSGAIINEYQISNLPTKKINETTLLSPGISTRF